MAKKRRKKSEGLGDTVETILEATGVAKIAKWVLGEDCNCEERKQKLNELFPYKKPLCLQEDEYTYLTEFFSRGTNRIKPTEQQQLLRIYNRVFKERQEPTTCSSCWQNILNKLSKVHNEY